MLNKLLSIIVATFFFTASAHANLLISPTFISFDEKNRSQSITLINSGNKIRSYRVEWKQFAALPDGGYRELTREELSQFSGLDKIVRISPKQVTLAPGERQIVKLFLRNKGNLTQAEYRSHLSFTSLPAQASTSSTEENRGISLNVLLSYTMPVVYRVGSVIVNPKITNISLVHKKEAGITNIKVELFHDDLFSTHGRLVANWTPINGPTRQVGLLNGYNFYPEVKNATTQFPWEDFKLEPGTLEVRYEGQAEFSGLLLGQKTLTITQQMINSIR